MKLFAYLVEILVDGVWTDITADVRRLAITRRSSDGGKVDPSECSVRLDARAGKYSPRDPASPYFGKIGRNTQLRVRARRAAGANVYRFWGEVPAWPLRWTLSGADRWVDVKAAGVLRRLGQGEAPSWSSMRRSIEGSAPVAYWPVEDGALAESAGAGLSGQGALQVLGTVEFKTVPDYLAFTGAAVQRFGTSALANLNAGGELLATVPATATTATAGGPWCLSLVSLTDPATLSGDVVLMEWTTTDGTYTRWQLKITTGSRTQVVGITAAGAATTLIDVGSASAGFTGHAVGASVAGGTVTVRLWRSTTAAASATATFAGTLGGVTSVASNPTAVTSTAEMPFGHLVVWAASSPQISLVSVADTWPDPYFVTEPRRSRFGEDASDRLARVAGETGVTVTVVAGTDSAAMRMGYQPPATLTELIEASLAVDGGLLAESRDALGLTYRRRASLYNQTSVKIAYVGQTTEPFDPVDDDELVRNDITVRRTEGASARAVQRDGRMAALPPPAGVGVYQTSPELNLKADAQLAGQAGWRLRLGTVDEPRFPSVTVQFAAPEWQAAPTLLDQLLAVDVGGVLEVTGLPSWVTGPARTLITGYTETITEELWEITYEGLPASPYDVGTVGGARRIAAAGATLSGPVTAGALSLPLTKTIGRWTTDAADFPLEIMLGVERVRLSAITGASGAAQTATVSARAVNGVSAAWPAGTTVDVAEPAAVAL